MTLMSPTDLITKSKTNETTAVSSRAFNSQFNSIYSTLRVADPQGTFRLIVFLWKRHSQPGRSTTLHFGFIHIEREVL